MFLKGILTFCCHLVAESSPILWDSIDCSLPGSSVHEILQARILDWVGISFSRGSSQPGIEPRSPALQADFYQLSYKGRLKVKVAQSCPTLCDPMDYTVHGILQAIILERVAFPIFRGSSQPRDRTQVFCIAGRFFTI